MTNRLYRIFSTLIVGAINKTLDINQLLDPEFFQ